MPIPGFGPAEFTLVILRRMADFNPGMVEEAHRALGASRTDAREANRRWQAMIRSTSFPRGARRYTDVLGPPERSLRRRIGDLSCTARQWALPLWPDLRFEIVLGPGANAAPWNEWLVRAEDSPRPELKSVADLRPWSCVVSDVGAAFPPARPREGSAPSRWQLDFTATEDGRQQTYTADFTWGLLQEVRPAYQA